MFNNMTCPAPDLNTTDYSFQDTQEGFEFIPSGILAGTIITAGAALLGAAHYQMKRILEYTGSNCVLFFPSSQPNRIELLKIARRLTQLDPSHPSLLDSSIHHRTSVLEDLIKERKVGEIQELLSLGQIHPCVFRYAIEKGLDDYIPFLIESGFEFTSDFFFEFFELGETRQNQLIDKMIGPKVSPLRGQGIPARRRRQRPTRTTLTEKQTKFCSKFFDRISHADTEEHRDALWRILDRLGAYHFLFNVKIALNILYENIEKSDEVRRLLQFFQQNGLEINKDLSDKLNEPESFPGPTTILDVFQRILPGLLAEGTTKARDQAQKLQAIMDLVTVHGGAKTWAQLHPEDTAPATA